MRYAIFTDIHANLEALEAVLAKIDELALEEPIDQIWFLGDLVGYGPNPNECIVKLRDRTDVIIAGNHDWAAVGKIDLEDFSAAARVSAEWTAEQLTEEHRAFLTDLPERIEIGDCTLVHGSPYGPLWEYLTSEVLAERSFQHFSSRYCFVGHTHVPVIFQQPDTIATTPTIPLDLSELSVQEDLVDDNEEEEDDDGTSKTVAIHPTTQIEVTSEIESPHTALDISQTTITDTTETTPETQQQETNNEVTSQIAASQEPEDTEETEDSAVPQERGGIQLRHKRISHRLP